MCFSFLLHQMLGNIEALVLSDTFLWSNHSQALAVHNPRYFAEWVLPLFSTMNLPFESSFTYAATFGL